MTFDDAEQVLERSKETSLKRLSIAEKQFFELGDGSDFTLGQKNSYSAFYGLAEEAFVIRNKINDCKNWCFHASLSHLINSRFTNVGVAVNGIGPAIAPLLSDNIKIIKDVVNWKNNNFHDHFMRKGAIFYIVKYLIAGDYETAQALWMKGKSHPVKKAAWYAIERDILRAMIDKDEVKTREAILHFLTPESIEKTLDDVFVSGYFFNTMTIAYLKLAYHLGMNLEIEHELVPKELVEFAPLDKYEIKYDFMKRDDLKDILDV